METTLLDLAELFKVFGDSTRIRIIHSLIEGEKNVTALIEELGMTQSAVSHQLRILKAAKLVRGRRDGKMIFYALDDEHVKKIFETGMDHITHE